MNSTYTDSNVGGRQGCPLRLVGRCSEMQWQTKLSGLMLADDLVLMAAPNRLQ